MAAKYLDPERLDSLFEIRCDYYNARGSKWKSNFMIASIADLASEIARYTSSNLSEIF